MSVERALRARLERDAAAVVPDDTAALERVLQGHRTRQRTRRAAYAVAGVAVLAAGLFLAPRVVDAWRVDRGPVTPVKEPSPGEDVVSPLAGTYATSIQDRPGLIRTYSLAGRWVMEVEASGEVRLNAPAGYVDALGVPSVGIFELDGGRLSTKVLSHPGLGCEETAVYAWSVTPSSLRLRKIEDSCRLRAPVLTSDWTRRR